MKYKRTGNTTKFAPVHVWLGRVVILLGTINAFLYVSPLSLNPLLYFNPSYTP